MSLRSAQWLDEPVRSRRQVERPHANISNLNLSSLLYNINFECHVDHERNNQILNSADSAVATADMTWPTDSIEDKSLEVKNSGEKNANLLIDGTLKSNRGGGTNRDGRYNENTLADGSVLTVHNHPGSLSAMLRENVSGVSENVSLAMLSGDSPCQYNDSPCSSVTETGQMYSVPMVMAQGAGDTVPPEGDFGCREPSSSKSNKQSNSGTYSSIYAPNPPNNQDNQSVHPQYDPYLIFLTCSATSAVDEVRPLEAIDIVNADQYLNATDQYLEHEGNYSVPAHYPVHDSLAGHDPYTTMGMYDSPAMYDSAELIYQAHEQGSEPFSYADLSEPSLIEAITTCFYPSKEAMLNPFELSVFRTVRCDGATLAHGCPSKTTNCWKFHYPAGAVVWKRRNPFVFDYKHLLCPRVQRNRQKGDSKTRSVGAFAGAFSCPKGLQCGYAHSLLEQMYHPSVYKTRPCQNVPQCTKPFCPFLHPHEAYTDKIINTWNNHRLNRRLFNMAEASSLGSSPGCNTSRQMEPIQLNDVPQSPPNSEDYYCQATPSSNTHGCYIGTPSCNSDNLETGPFGMINHTTMRDVASTISSPMGSYISMRGDLQSPFMGGLTHRPLCLQQMKSKTGNVDNSNFVPAIPQLNLFNKLCASPQGDSTNISLEDRKYGTITSDQSNVSRRGSSTLRVSPTSPRNSGGSVDSRNRAACTDSSDTADSYTCTKRTTSCDLEDFEKLGPQEYYPGYDLNLRVSLLISRNLFKDFKKVLSVLELSLVRTTRCPLRTGCVSSKTPTKCWATHTGSESVRWLRRNPFAYEYKHLLCPTVRVHKDTPESQKRNSWLACSEGLRCKFAHSIEEQMYHPIVYKTTLCTNESCERPFCPFLHERDGAIGKDNVAAAVYIARWVNAKQNRRPSTN